MQTNVNFYKLSMYKLKVILRYLIILFMLMLRNYLRTITSSVHLRNRYGIKLNDCGLAGYSSHQSLMVGLQSKRDKDRIAITNAFISRMLINYVASCPAFSLPRETSIRESILDETLIK